MIRFTTRSFAVLVMSLILLSALAAPAGISAKPSGDGPGNAPNAKKCQNGGWATLAPEEDAFEAFVSEETCVAFGAKGGTIVPVQVTALMRCENEARAVGFDPAAFEYIWVGTTGNDRLATQYDRAAELICGFEGDDTLSGGLGPGDVFLGGAGNDFVDNMWDGSTFYSGAGDDSVTYLLGGTFYGGPGNDSVTFSHGGTFIPD